MRISFRKLSNTQHALEIRRADGQHEAVQCETRSYLTHDLLHYAVESEAALDGGFWGNLAAGKTLADMNDRTGASMPDSAGEMAAIEQIVGALSSAVKGVPAERLVETLRRNAAALARPLPDWFDEAFIEAVQERMRRLLGHWNATPFGAEMQLAWPSEDASRRR
jgi:hypothetical protein